MEVGHTVDVLENFKPYLPAKGSKFNGQQNSLTQESKEIEIEAGAMKCDASTSYREVVGSLLWLANGSRPDISFAVNQVAKYCCDPRTAHWKACKRIL